MAEAIELAQVYTSTSGRGERAPSEVPFAQQPSVDSISNYNEDGDGPVTFEALPPVDGGRRAWLFLLGATVTEILVWGLPFSVGILHVYWTNTLFQGYGESTITLAATLQTGLLYIGAMIFGPILSAFPKWSKAIQVFGLIGGATSMIASAFATKPWHLVVTFGLLYPLAGAQYLPCATLLFEWFHSRRGLASGIMYAGTGAGGTVFPFIMDGLLKRFGYRAAMISLGVGYLVVGSLALIPIHRRIPLARHDHGIEGKRRRPKVDWGFFKRTSMYLGVMTILMTSLGNFVPSLWLPSYADELKLTKPNGTALIALLNASSVFGNGLLGFLSDRWPLKVVIPISCVGSALACAFLWGFGTSDSVLIIFALVFGLLGQSFSAVWSKMISTITLDDHVTTPIVFSIMTGVRGIGSITSGPVANALLQLNILNGASGAYGLHNYGILLIYTATTILGGAVTGVMFRENVGASATLLERRRRIENMR